MADREQALAELQALLAVKGALKIITSEVADELKAKPGDPNSPMLQSKAIKFVREARGLSGSEDEGLDHVGAALKMPSAFVLHDVTSLEGPDLNGAYRAYSDEGDHTSGFPEDLLRRLREWRA